MKENSEKKLFKILGTVFLVLLLGFLTMRILRDGIYATTSGINVLVAGDSDMSLLILRPDEDIIGWVYLPKNLKVKIFNSSAEYPLETLWDYGVSEKNPIEIAGRSLGLSMGIAIARTIKVDGPASYDTLLTALHGLGTRTNLSVRDRFLIRQYLAESLASKKILEMDIPKNAMESVEEPDGKKFAVFNSIISLWTKNKFLLESILNENAEVSVNNLTGINGMGIAVSRQLESAGFRVVEVKSDAEVAIPEGNGCLFVSWGSYPNSEDFLKHQLNCRERIGEKGSDKRGVEVWLK